jgi:uncharacterized protein YecE (DUF72 family)
LAIGKDTAMTKDIHVGPAGWSYKDWEGLVYPPKHGSKFDPLSYLAQFFNTIEINSSFYRPPAPATAKSWALRVAANVSFRFTAKLHRIFTHERGKATTNDDKLFRQGMGPLAESGKLGAVLIQFPWSFKNTGEERAYLMRLLTQFQEYPLVLEVRHASWNEPGIYEELEERGVGICNIDQPLFSRSIKPAAVTTSRIGYIRLHGRNYADWFREQAPRDDRYNYLYSLDELDPWITRIRAVAKQTKESYVITNNHFLGKAVVNALEIKSILDGNKVPAPRPLFEKYPQLEAVATAEKAISGPIEPSLFG